MISSQEYLNQEIVEAKIEANDFDVTTATITDGDDTYVIIVDGHHSLEAAKQSGNAPIFTESDYGYQAEVDSIGFADFMAQQQNDTDWYDVDTGCPVF